MNEIIKNIEAAQLKETVPSFNVGDTVRVSAKIKEGNRERIQVFEGTVINNLVHLCEPPLKSLMFLIRSFIP